MEQGGVTSLSHEDIVHLKRMLQERNGADDETEEVAESSSTPQASHEVGKNEMVNIIDMLETLM